MFVVPAVAELLVSTDLEEKHFWTIFKVEIFSVAAKLKVRVKTELGTFLSETMSVVKTSLNVSKNTFFLHCLSQCVSTLQGATLSSTLYLIDIQPFPCTPSMI